MHRKPIRETIMVNKPGPPTVADNRYIGFVADIFSGVTKLFVGYRFDTIKVRLQTAPANQFRGPLDCFLKTTRGFRALYKGATPSLLGGMVMDSVNFAGWTLSFVAAPIEHIKVHYDAATKAYTSAINSGTRGLYRGLFSTMVFGSYFSFLYDIMTHLDKENRDVRIAAANFWAGGQSLQIFWTLAYLYPSDVVKQAIITDNVTNSRHKTWIDAARYVYNERGFKGFF
ncbi:mitochondrial carrier domain-containing protein [Lipomyces starkeyi]